MEPMLAKLVFLENGLNSMREQQKSMRHQHTEEMKSVCDQQKFMSEKHTEEMKSMDEQHSRDMKSLLTKVQFLERIIQNGDASAKTEDYTHEVILQKPPHNEQQLNTINWVHTRKTEVVASVKKNDVQVHDNPGVSSDAEIKSQKTGVSDTEKDEVMQQLQDKFASEETKRSMTSNNVQTYPAYPGYSEEKPISPAQSCCSAAWIMFLALLSLSTSLLTVLQRAFCHPILLAMAGSGSWYGLEFWKYDTYSEIEKLARHNLTIDQVRLKI